MIQSRSFRPRVALTILGVSWLVLMAGLVWLHARESTQPPIYDALTYFTKAKFVWAAIAEGDLQHLLVAEPAFRPPATVLMSFPFGFDGSYSGFYFRSVFLPILLVFVAVCIALWERTHAMRDALWVALTAGFLTTLSLFFYFEPYDGVPPATAYWGLVDGFQTGLAAMTTASAVRSIRSHSMGWGLASTLLGVVMIYVKPSGTLLAAVTGALLTVGWLHQAQLSKAGPRRSRRLAAVAVLICLQTVLLGGALFFAMSSQYLGSESMAFGKAAMQVMRSEIHLDFAGYLNVIRLGLGPVIPIWITCASLMLIYGSAFRRQRGEQRRLDMLLLIMSALVIAVGAWFWLVESGGLTQVRYFTPFLYVAIIASLGPLLRVLDALGRPMRWVMASLMLVAVCNTVLLLALPAPALAWQTASGVNLMSGSIQPSIDEAQDLVDTAQADAKSVVVYSMAFDINDAMFESVFYLSMLNKSGPRFGIRRPLDWARPTTFRRDELAESDYILFDPRQAMAALPKVVKDFAGEQIVFQSWANGLSAADGIELRSRQPAATLLRVVDHTKLRRSVDKLIATHEWRPIFRSANSPHWWSFEEIDKASGNPSLELNDVKFGDKFDARVASLGALADGETELKVWIRSLNEQDKSGWIMLVHYLDSDGKILSAPDVALSLMEESTAAKPYLFVHEKFFLPPNADKVAIGIYRGDTLLIADKGTRDWGGKRILLSQPDRRTP